MSFPSSEQRFQAADEVAGFFAAQAERRKEADHVGPAGAGEDVLLIDEALAQLFDRIVKLHSDHEALSAHLAYAGQMFQLVHEVRTHGGGILDKVFAFDYVEHGKSRGAGQMVSAEGGAEHSVDGFENRADEHGAHGEAVGDSLGHGDEVGADAGVLMGKETAAAPVAGLYLVEDEDGAGGGTKVAQALQILGSGQHDSPDALYAFDDDGADVAFLYLAAGGSLTRLVVVTFTRASADDMKSLRKAIAGAEKTPKGFHEMWNESFGDTYREGYGLTEATPVVGVNLPDRDFGFFSTGSRKGSIGKLFPGMQAKILDPTTLAPLPFGEQGLLAMRGANIFAGYLDNPKATAEALHGEWLITGDLSRIDKDGFLYIDGRLSRFSKIGGEMVPHATVETALNNELGFAASDTPLIAVSSRLDEGKGEALVLLSATDITLADVKNALRKAGISNLWHPKYLVRVDKIPLLPSGKLDLKTIGELAKRTQ